MLLFKRKFNIPVIKEHIVGGAMTSNRIVGMTSTSMKSPHSSSMASSIVGGDYMDFQNRWKEITVKKRMRTLNLFLMLRIFRQKIK